MKKIFCCLLILLIITMSITIALRYKAINTATIPDLKSGLLTPDQLKQVGEYIINNPDILVKANKKLQEQEAAKETAKIKQIKDDIIKHKKEVFDDKTTGRIVSGNPNGARILVEFTQYQCTHCKAVTPIIDKLIKENPDLKLITIFWPFFGDDAIYATKAVLAAQKQNKFNELHKELMNTTDFLTKEKIDEAIKKTLGINIKKLHSDMDSNEIVNSIKANIKLATDMKLMGTPTFAISNSSLTKLSMIPGQTINLETDLRQALNEVK